MAAIRESYSHRHRRFPTSSTLNATWLVRAGGDDVTADRDYVVGFCLLRRRCQVSDVGRRRPALEASRAPEPDAIDALQQQLCPAARLRPTPTSIRLCGKRYAESARFLL